ncbi:MAG: transcription antitermination factor NusB [Actinomycetota bacterium]
MPKRRGARKLALDILYEHDVTGFGLDKLLERYSQNPAFVYASGLVNGVRECSEELDGLIQSHATDWALDRMPVLDLNLMRIALYEMLHALDVPVAVAINEAVELAKIYSTPDSSRFVNGVLGKLASEKA